MCVRSRTLGLRLAAEVAHQGLEGAISVLRAKLLGTVGRRGLAVAGRATFRREQGPSVTASAMSPKAEPSMGRIRRGEERIGGRHEVDGPAGNLRMCADERGRSVGGASEELAEELPSLVVVQDAG